MGKPRRMPRGASVRASTRTSLRRARATAEGRPGSAWTSTGTVFGGPTGSDTIPWQHLHGPSAARRQPADHRLELEADVVRVPDPEALKLLGDERAVPVERVEDEQLAVAREDERVGEAGGREGRGRKPQGYAGSFRPIPPRSHGVILVRSVPDPPRALPRPPERIDEDPADLIV